MVNPRNPRNPRNPKKSKKFKDLICDLNGLSLFKNTFDL